MAQVLEYFEKDPTHTGCPPPPLDGTETPHSPPELENDDFHDSGESHSDGKVLLWDVPPHPVPFQVTKNVILREKEKEKEKEKEEVVVETAVVLNATPVGIFGSGYLVATPTTLQPRCTAQPQQLAEV